MKTLLKLAAIAALCLPAMAQTTTTPVWVKVATDPDGVVLSGVTWKFGDATAGCFSPTSTASINTWLSNLLPYGLVSSDPCPGINKSLYVMETATAQKVMVNNVAVSVPALAPTTTTYTITCTATATLTNGAPLPTTLPLTGISCTAVKK